MTQLCVPVTDIFRRNQKELLSLTGAVTFKQPSDEFFDGKEHMLECSLNIADRLFPEKLEQTGLLRALRSGRYTSFACDLGPAWQTITEGRSSNGYPRYLPGSHRMDETEYLKHAHRSLDFLRNRFQGRIKVENLNYFPTEAYELVCEPDFIARALHDLDVELLLDIGHLSISAHNLGIRWDDYLGRLPLERLSEVQLSGSSTVNGITEDTHDLPSEQDLEILGQVVAQAPTLYVTLEYYKDDRRLVAQYRQLHQMLSTNVGGISDKQD